MNTDNTEEKMYENSTPVAEEDRSYSLFHKRPYTGFEIRVVDDGNGKKHLEEFYVGEYYIADNRKLQLRSKLVYSLLFVAAVVMSMIAMLREVPANALSYVFISEGLAFMLFIVLAISVFGYVKAGEKMTIGQYKRAVLYLPRYCLATAVALLIATVGSIVAYTSDTDNTQQLLCIILFGLSILALLAMAFIESRHTYHTEK